MNCYTSWLATSDSQCPRICQCEVSKSRAVGDCAVEQQGIPLTRWTKLLLYEGEA